MPVLDRLPVRFHRTIASCAALGAALVTVFLCQPAQASCSDETSCENELGYRRELIWGAHLSYGLGAALLSGAVEPGFRHHLELAAAFGPGKDWLSVGNSVTGSTAPITGPLFGASGLLGLGSSPSYALVEGGYGRGSLAGIGGFLGAGARLSSSVAPVVGLRANADVLFLNAGLRALSSFERRPDMLVCFTAGLGRF